MGMRRRGEGCRPGVRRHGRLALPLVAALAFLLAATPARATFHEMSIREVYPGGSDNASYVELQMWAAGQTFVAGHHLVAYDSEGKVSDDFEFAKDVSNGANQSTILVADTNYSVVFDERPAPDESDANLNLSPAGGAVCWIEGSPPDCVAWGDFKGPLPAHVPELKAGSPAAPTGVSAGMALRRSIAKGCPTLLELSDDSNDSATDFSEVGPNPRDNATPPSEKACPPIPNTAIDSKPPNPSKSTSASFTYHAIPSTEAKFECALDGAPFAECPSSGIEYPGPLGEESHSFEVRAVNPTGTDATPASYTWTVNTSSVDETPPETSILSMPASPSSSSTASFTYESSEPGSSFECALDAGAFVECPPTGITYLGLGAGTHTFRVRAIDPSENVDPTPAEYSFAIVFPTPAPGPPPSPPPAAPLPGPPETTLLGKPPTKTHDRTPTFRFGSPIAGAAFQCKLDGGPYRPCRSPFTTRELSYGRHTLRVRAVLGGSVDPTPSVLRFKVGRR